MQYVSMFLPHIAAAFTFGHFSARIRIHSVTSAILQQALDDKEEEVYEINQVGDMTGKKRFMR